MVMVLTNTHFSLLVWTVVGLADLIRFLAAIVLCFDFVVFSVLSNLAVVLLLDTTFCLGLAVWALLFVRVFDLYSLILPIDF